MATRIQDQAQNKSIMSKIQIRTRLRLEVQCKNRDEVQVVASKILSRMGSHVTSMSLGQKAFNATLLPLDPQYFDAQESHQFLLRTLRDSLGKGLSLVLTKIKRV